MGEISEIKTGPFGSILHADDYVSEGVPIITTEHFKTGSLPQNASGLPQVSEVDYKRLSAYTLNNGDIVFSRVGSVDINALVTPFQRNWLFSGRVLRVRPEIDVLPQFLHTRLETESIKNDICARAVGQTMPSINTEILKATQLVLPTSMAEQKQIGLYFAKLDHLITLHQRKYDKLQVLKKAMLEKMFPKNGSSVPEIRFKGFTDAWEQRKLGEILQERNTRTSDFESNPLYSLTIESGVTPKTDRYERSSLVTKTEDLFKTVKPNEFVTNPMNLRFGALGYNKNAFTVSVSGYYDVFSIDDDKCSGFWNAYFKTPTAMNIFDNAATGSLIEKRRVKYSTLQQLAFYMPNDLSEKAEIGKYMDTFDHLITLHQRELEKLQNIKKSMLEKMFV